MDMGTSNVDMFDEAAARFVSQDNIYFNTTATLRYFAETLRKLGVMCSSLRRSGAIPMMRLAKAFAQLGLLDEPLLLSLNLIEGGLITAHPGTAKGLRAHLDFLPEEAAHEWVVTFFGGNLLNLAGMIIAEGGHIATGIGDYPYPEPRPSRPTPTSRRRVAQIAADAGREVATPAEAKELLRANLTGVAAGQRATGKQLTPLAAADAQSFCALSRPSVMASWRRTSEGLPGTGS